MATKRAKTLDDKQLRKVLEHISENSTLPERDHLIVALSFKAGLRAAEIQKIDLKAMLTADGAVDDTINVFSHVGKKQRERSIPMHPLVKKALKAFMKAYPNATFVAISSRPFQHLVRRGEAVPKDATFKRMSVTAITQAYWNLLNEAGFEGTSSHSGRRTFITELARKANKHHCSIRDVQILAGHARLDTTERYIALSDDASALVNAI